MTNQGLDSCLQLVADQHRRQVIHNLRREAEGTATFSDLVEQLSSRAADSTDGPPQDREELAIRLQHTHLPKLADHGVIDFDHRTGTVRYQPDEQVEAVLDSLAENLSPWVPDASDAHAGTASRPDR